MADSGVRWPGIALDFFGLLWRVVNWPLALISTVRVRYRWNVSWIREEKEKVQSGTRLPHSRGRAAALQSTR